MTATGTFDDAAGRDWARRVATALPHRELAHDIERALHTMLATTQRHTWDDLLAYGVTLAAHGRLVWLRPALADLRPVTEETEQAVREYNVRFATTAAGGERTSERSLAADSALLLGLNTASAVASSVILGMPQLRAEATSTSSGTLRRNVISGRTLFSSANQRFSAGVRVRVFVDGVGVEHASDAVLDRALRVDIPREYTGADAPRPAMAEVAAEPRSGEAGPGPDPLVLNAVDLAPLVAALHRRLLGAGLDAATVERFMTQAGELLNERTARTRSRWWLTNGDISGMIRVPGTAGRSFHGRLTVRAGIESLEFAGVSEGVQIREDLGRGMARGLGRAGGSSTGISLGFNAYGFTLPTADGTGTGSKGLLPLLGVGVDRGTRSGLAVTAQNLSHTVLNSADDQARYRARLRITVEVKSPTRARIEPVTEEVEAEIGVPWRDGQGARQLEERVLGSVHTPGLAPDGLAVRPGPVSTHPHVRALLRESGTEPVRAMEPPERLAATRGAPHPAEPWALAARRGLGFAMALAMPGSEIVQDHLSWALKRAAPRAARRPADWAAVEAELGLHFSRPALEANLPLDETVHTVTVGGRRYRLSVRAVLLDRLRGTEYPMTVNARAARTDTVTGRRGTEWSAVVGGGGGALVPLGGSTRLRFGGLTVRGGVKRSREERFTAANTVYRRTETVGSVDEHVYDTVYEVSVSPERAGRHIGAERWWIDRPGLVTQIVVPRQHVPAQPADAGLVAEVGRAAEVSSWPDRAAQETAPEVDFARGGTGGVYPAFVVMPELTRLAAEGYARLAGLPADWAEDPGNWPEPLLELTGPTALAARLGAMTGPHGYETELERGGWRYAVRLRLRAFAARDLGPTAGETEIEQYSQSTDRYGRANKQTWHAGLSASVGPQIAIGALAGGTHHESAAVTDGPAGQEGSAAGDHRETGTGLRAVALAEAGAQWAWGRDREQVQGMIEITRATYRATPHVVHASPVFEVTVVRSKGSSSQETVRYLRVERGLELLVPERRLEDLLPPPPAAPARTPGPVQDGPVQDGTVQDGTVLPRARAHLAGHPLPGAAHPERLRADDVLKTIVERLDERGTPGRSGPAREQLLRALRATFSSDALQTQYTALTGTGVSRWFPLSGSFGSTRYVWVRVTADVAAPHSHRPRAEIRLTLRSEAVIEDKAGVERSFHAGAALGVRTRIGGHDSHGGVEIEASYGMGGGRSHETDRQNLDISRANTRDTSEEFEHRLTFRIEMGATTEPPAALSVPLHAVRESVQRAAALVRGGAPAPRWDPVRVWTWQDDGLGDGREVTGDVRLLVPSHLTVPTEQPVPPVVTRARPDAPEDAPRPSWTDPAAVPSPAVPEALKALTEFFHPWGVSAAQAVQRWARAAAHQPVRVPDLTRDRAWQVPGIDPLTAAGMSYDHHTSTAMLRANIASLLQHRYRVPVGGRTVTVGFHLAAAEVVGPAEGVAVKARRYRQDRATSNSEHSGSRGGVLAIGPEAGGTADGDRVYDRLTLDAGVGTGHKEGFEAGETRESNQEATRRYRHYRFDVTVLVRPEGDARRALSIEVPGGLYGMLPLNPDGTLAGGLEQALPHLFSLPRPAADPGTGPAEAGAAGDGPHGVETAASDTGAGQVEPVAGQSGGPAAAAHSGTGRAESAEGEEGTGRAQTFPAEPAPAVTTAREQVVGPGPDRLSSSVTEFGTTRDGSQGLVHITPVPEDTVGWLQEQVIRQVEGGRGEDPAFRQAVRATLTSRLLSSEWARLLSEHGLPLRAAHGGRTYQISLRLGLSGPRRVSPQIEEMPDGPPVNVQRWVFGISESGTTDSVGDLRSASLSYAHTLPFADTGLYRRLTLTPQFTLTHGQTTTSVTAGATVQPMVLLRSRERSWPIAYGMNWGLRTTPSLAHASTGSPFPDQWHPLTDGPGTPLTVWFPQHLVEDEADPVTLTGEDPEQRPASMRTLLDRVPLFATETVPRADAFLSDALRSFPDELADISEPSLDQLRHFLAEGSMRGNLPLMYGGHHTSPTLFARDGSVIGMLRLHADVIQRTDVGALAGPPTRNSVLESHVLRSVRLSGGAAVTHAVGIGLGVSGGFAAGRPDPVTGKEPIGFTLTGQAAVQQQATHTLVSGGSARTSRALRTARPLLRVNADAVYQVTLVRPGGPERGPAEGTPLAAPDTRYPLILRVPSAATVSGIPRTPRHLPPEILHLRDVGVSVTPLAVEGTRPLFDDVEAWLRDHGFLPPSQDRAGAWHQAPTSDAVHLQRLNNLRKLDQIRSSMGLRAGLDEMTAGGHPTRFEVDTATGVHRATFRITVERRYLTDRADGGVTHDLHLAHVQTLNYSGSTIAGDEQLTRVPLAVSGTVQASLTNPFDAHGNLWLQGLTPEYAHSRQTTVATNSSAGTGHEFYALSPTANGVQVHTLPVTYRTSLSSSDGPAMAPGRADGQVTLAVPTYRTLEQPTAQQQAVVPPPVRPPTEADVDGPADLRLPETAWPDRVGGSRELRDAVHAMLQAVAHQPAAGDTAAARSARADDGVELARMPGAWPEQGTGDHARDRGPGDDGGNPAVGDHGDRVPAHRWPAHALDGASRAVRMTGDAALGVIGRVATGERLDAARSLAQEVVETGLSPHHLTANAHRLFNDSYVVEGAGTSGVLAGTDVIVEVEGRLRDVRALPRPGVMDYERWIQSVDASADTRSTTRGHALGVTAAADYGDSRRAFAPSGHFALRRTGTDSTTVHDNSAVFRVTSENDVPAHRFAATAVYRVTVRAGLRNVVATTVAGGPRYEETRIVEVPDAVEFLLSDHDLGEGNHPEFVLEGVSRPQAAAAADRRLPSSFTDSGGQIGFGSVVEVHPEDGRSAFQRTIRQLVERVAPGSTVPGTATYLPGVLSRINEHGSSLGLRTLINAGPDGHTAFHFVHRSWLGPMVVEVALRARPAESLTAVRGRRALGNPGLDNVLGHSSGDGGVLPVPGSTRQTRVSTTAGTADFSPLLQYDGYRLRPTLSATRQTGTADTATSTRERRAWQRSMMDVSEFPIRYRYEATVSARPMRDVPTAAAPWLLAEPLNAIGRRTGLTDLAGRAFGRLPEGVRTSVERWADLLPRPVQRVSGTVEARAVLRFNGSETPADPVEGPPQAGGHPLVSPAVYTADPSREPVPGPGETVVDLEIPLALRRLLGTEPWIPRRPFALHHFDGLPQLAEALRAVDPALGGRRALPTSTSAEGMLVRLNQLAATGRVTLLPPAATAPFLGQPGTGATSVQLALYSPRSVAGSPDTAIDRVEISTDGAFSQGDLTTTSALGFGFSAPTSHGTGRLGPTVPVTGQRTTTGLTHSHAVPRREMLRFGTPVAGAARGVPGHLVRAVVLVRVTGPNGTRWVAGTAVLRTTEAPPAPRASGDGRRGPAASSRHGDFLDGGSAPSALTSSPPPPPLSPAPGMTPQRGTSIPSPASADGSSAQATGAALESPHAGQTRYFFRHEATAGRDERLMGNYVGAAHALVQAVRAHHHLAGRLAGGGTSRDAGRWARSEEQLRTAEDRFDDAERGLVEAGHGDLSGRDRPGLPRELSSLPAATFREVMGRADRLLGRPAIGQGESDAIVRAQWDARISVALNLVQGHDEAARALAADLSEKAGFHRGGLPGGALELDGKNLTEAFRERMRDLDEAARARVAPRMQSLRSSIRRAEARLADIEDERRRGEARIRDVRSAARRAEERLDNRGRLLVAITERHLLDANNLRPDLRSVQASRIRQHKVAFEAESARVERQVAEADAHAEQWNRRAGELERRRHQVSSEKDEAVLALDRLEVTIERNIVVEGRRHLAAVVDSLREQMGGGGFWKTMPDGLSSDELDRFRSNWDRIERKLKKLIVEPTGHRGHHLIIGGEVGKHPEYGAKMHDVKHNNATDLARGLVGWVEAKPNRHREKLIAQRVESEGHVERLLDVLLTRFQAKIDSLPSRKSDSIWRELAAGKSEIEPGKWLGQYLIRYHPGFLPVHRRHLASAVWSKGGVPAVLRDPDRFELWDKIMVWHDLSDYFMDAPRHTPRTHGTKLLPDEQGWEWLSTTRIDESGRRVATTTNLGRNRVRKSDGTSKEHPSTRDENDPTTRLARSLRLPVWAGQSLTAMRMFRIAEWAKASKYEIGAVAWGIFARWRLHYDHTSKFAYHTLHEILDIAENYGVSYSPLDPYAGLEKISRDRAIDDALIFGASVAGEMPDTTGSSVRELMAWREAGKLSRAATRVRHLVENGENEAAVRREFIAMLKQFDRARDAAGMDDDILYQELRRLR
ncbi:hypothetical protein ACFWA5_33225 [Streptomyces mirabilis]|uniref:hypothetical protein n=1 Tax=Streptomyces mirabilis TaxID=68239 RepID=UPI003649411B